MSLDSLYALIPAYARDLAQNLSVLADETVLDDQQKWGVFLACAHAVGVPPVVRAFAAHAGAPLTPEAVTAARAWKKRDEARSKRGSSAERAGGEKEYVGAE